MLMEKIGIFYGSTTGITESVAYRLAELMHVKKRRPTRCRTKQTFGNRTIRPIIIGFFDMGKRRSSRRLV